MKLPTEDYLVIGFDNSDYDETVMVVGRSTSKGLNLINNISESNARRLYCELIGIKYECDDSEF